MGTFASVRAAELGALIAAAIVVLLVVRAALLRRRALPSGVARLAREIPDALGDAVIALDRSGRVAFANPGAARLTGVPLAELLDRDVRQIAPELAALARGLERGPASARITLAARSGPVLARAALVRISSRPPLALAVLRRVPAPAPAPGAERAAAADARGREVLAAAAGALHDPIARAAQAVSMLRLAAPPLSARADGALTTAEQALDAAARRVTALAAAGVWARRTLDLSALVEDLVASFPAPPGVRLRLEIDAARALADDRPLRAAVRELLAGAAAGLAAGGEIRVAVGGGSTAPAVEIRGGGVATPGSLALARALVATQGGRVEEDPLPGRGSAVRIALEPPPALALAPAGPLV